MSRRAARKTSSWPVAQRSGRWLYLPLAVGAGLMAFPLLWMVSTSLKAPEEIFTPQLTLWPHRLMWSNYAFGWVESGFGKYFLNTTVIAAGAVASSVLFNSMAGFALAKYRFAGREAIFLFILSALMVPIQVKIVPLYLLTAQLGWVDRFPGAILPTISQAFGVFLMRQYCSTIPDELIEASRIDGCSEFRIFWRVVFPLCKPAMAVNVIFQFMWRWNDLLWPLIVLRSEKMYTIQQGLAFFRDNPSVAGGPIMAMSLVSVLPIALVFFALQKYFVQGIALTGMKE
ncbi:MAG TPA: carbohydrate ABC transporter permease [Candidatus Sulfotelmatobacter sp.]|nr:carbohydrate ABC transporter permease [Candidatus Sulfotelmatobacter sp.]